MDEATTRMSTAECWDFLRRHELGRLAFLLVEIEVTEISGRHFELSRPWTHLIPD